MDSVPDPELHADDTLPPSERNRDEARAAHTQELLSGDARPLTSQEREAAERDPGVSPRVYAPADERVPKPPVPGHRDLVDQVDPATPERRSAGARPEPSPPPPWVRPSGAGWRPASDREFVLSVGAGTLALLGGAVAAAWLVARWWRERNRPINRLRRQARRAASGVGEPARGRRWRSAIPFPR